MEQHNINTEQLSKFEELLIEFPLFCNIENEAAKIIIADNIKKVIEDFNEELARLKRKYPYDNISRNLEAYVLYYIIEKLWNEFLKLDECKNYLEQKGSDDRNVKISSKCLMNSKYKVLANPNLLICAKSLRQVKIYDHFMRWLYPIKRKINLSFVDEVV